MDGNRFRRQHPLGDFIVDFICIEKRLIVEVDGGQHADQTEKDSKRTAWLIGQGFEVLRFWNNEVLNDVEAVKRKIWEALEK